MSTRVEPARGAARHAHLDLKIAHGLWAGVPTLSWAIDLATGKLRFNEGERVAGALDPDAWSAGLRPHIERNGRGSFQTVEVLPGPTGTPHTFLIVGFPLAHLVGVTAPCLGGVAIDVTHYRQRLDELARQALVDELTGLYNRRGFMLFAEHELKVAQRRETTSAVVYVDVDGMKLVNDTHGHDEGNHVLIAVAKLLRQVFRECDVICRLGGDEFAVFASDVRGDPEQLRARLVAQLQAAGPVAGTAVLAISVGVAACAPGAIVPLNDLLAAADESMYKDKVRGPG